MNTPSWGNHFRVGFGPALRQSRAFVGERWVVEFGKCGRMPGSFKAELLAAARLLADSTEEEIVVLLSGGIDSEIVLRSLVAVGANVSAAIAVYEDGFNKHDVRYAFDYCEAAKVRHRVLRLDVREFFSQEVFDYCALSQCISPQHAAHMWMIDQVEGLPVLGYGDTPIVREPDGQWRCVYGERTQGAAHRFLHARQRRGVIAYFCYTPELMYAFLADPANAAIVSGVLPSASDAAVAKAAVYAGAFPDLKRRPKFTGFEGAEAMELEARRCLDPLYRNWDDHWSMPYDEFLASLLSRVGAQHSGR